MKKLMIGTLAVAGAALVAASAYAAEGKGARWDKLDKNADGVVDKTEFINAAQERFDKMDKDGNGVLSEDEMRRKHGRRHRRGDRE